MDCKNCGGELRSDATFCTNCGTRIEAEQVQNESLQPDQPEPEQHHDQLTGQENLQGELPESSSEQPFSPYHTPPLPGQFVQQPAQYQTQSIIYGQQQGHYGQQTMMGIPPSGKKKTNIGMIIGISLGGVVLLGIAFALGIVIGIGLGTGIAREADNLFNPDIPVVASPIPLPDILPPPQPVDTPPPNTPPAGVSSDNELIARWERLDGDYLWFFGDSDYVEFIELSDGTLNIFLTDDDGRGSGYIIDATGKLFVTASWGSEYEFDYVIDDELLIIIDSDFDTAYYNRLG